MGTTYQIRVVAPASELEEISAAVEKELAEVNDQMSTYLPDSEVSRFNRSTDVDSWFPVSEETAAVVHEAQLISESTDGAFDVTVGPLVNLWGFGPDGLPEAIPTDEQLEELKAFVGTGLLKVRAGEQEAAISKGHVATEIDLSAIAKGHGVDRVAGLLSERGLANYFVEIGGEVRTSGAKPSGEPWRLGIEKPIVGERGIFTVLELNDAAVATSGSYRNLYEYDGERYSHTIDPRTGKPVRDDLVSATVVSERCVLADAVATSMMSLGFVDGLEYANENGWAVLLIAEKNGFLQVATSENFDALYPDWENPVANEQSPASKRMTAEGEQKTESETEA